MTWNSWGLFAAMEAILCLTPGPAVLFVNPKALLFFVALLPQFVSPVSPILPLIVILGATSVFIEFCVLATYGYLAG